MNYRTLSSKTAICLALEAVSLQEEACTRISCLLREDYYEITVHTLFLRYELYVDRRSGQIPGINTEPLSDPQAQEETPQAA